MTFRIAFVAVLLTALLTCCSDRYRNPCEAIATSSTMRTKNKALGWVNPPMTTVYGSYGRHVIHKCA